MNEIVKINNHGVAVKEYKGSRVVTFKDIDTVHERVEGTARKRFNDNKTHFIEGADFFKVKCSEVRPFFGQTSPNGFNPEADITLVTESGYLMLVKSFTDDLAWKVQRQLVNSYFNGRSRKLEAPATIPGQIQLLAQGYVDLEQKVDNVEQKVVNLENNMTIDYGQQRVLGEAVAKTVVGVLGGKSSRAYKEISKKVFAECNRDLKHYFNVNSRNNVPKKRFEEAIEYARNWKPCTNTMMMIHDCNARQELAV